MAKKFVHLHVHTEYSLLDGLSKSKNLVNHIKENGMDSVAVTDHGVMYGVIEFYKNAKKGGVKPIIGMEAYTTTLDHTKKPERGKTKNYHLLLLAKNKKGYKNLMKLTSIGHLEGYYYKPRVDRETLAKHSDGLICTSACPQGEIAQALTGDNYSKAKEIAKWFLDVFDKDYYLEIQRHEYDKHLKNAEEDEVKKDLREMAENEKIINDGVVKLSRELGIPIVATNDVHYTKKEDAKAQDALVCIATGKNVSDVKRLRFIDAPSYYAKPPEEMHELFSDLPEALENTVKIADKCSVDITLDKWYFPKYELEEGKTPDEEMEEKVWKGIKEKVPKVTEKIKERLEYEMGIIKEKGYSTYFLIVSDMARWAAKNGIVTNTRGSAAGSLVSYAMGIININPLKYDLPFERFLTPWRPSPPDIDFDIADDRREEVIEYITKKYGKEKVAQICTFGRMLARGAVRDVARVLGYPYEVGDKVSKAIPQGSQGFPMTIKKALQESPELNSMYEDDEDVKKIIDLAMQIEGSARHVSVHAAGLVIAPEEITNYTPIQLDPDGKKIITQYDMEALDPNVSSEAIGLLKFDLLGLRNLAILGSAIDIIEKEEGDKVKLAEIPLDDEKPFEMLSRGETMGVFQLSGSGMTRYLKELKPTRVEDIMAMVALYRPGPMAQIPEYIERKNNPGKVSYFDPRMKEYLGKSYGLIVYQDDVFMTAIKIAGYSWEEADKFRKAVGKKIPEEMERQKKKFIEGAVENGMEKEKAEELFKLIEPFSGYGFNKAHAAAYGMVAYWTAYLKANHPVEFMCALLTAESGNTDKVSEAVGECKRMGIKVLSPDINDSAVGFKIVKDKDSLNGQAIRFGLSAIKNVGKAAIESILGAREEGRFASFADFISRVDNRKVNKKVLESLIKVGALSEFGKRAALISSIDEVRSRVAKPAANENQRGLFTKEEIKKSMKSGKDSLIKTDIEEFNEEEMEKLERQLLGLSLSAKPVDELIGSLKPLATHNIDEVSVDELLGNKIKVAGVVSDVRVVVTKKSGQEMAFVKVKDETGAINLVVFPKMFQNTRGLWTDNKPVLVTGKVNNRDDEMSLIVNDIETEDSVKEEKDRLFIKVPKDASSNSLKSLKKILMKNKGSQEVTLLFEDNGGKKIDLNIKVNWNADLARKISQIFESDNLN